MDKRVNTALHSSWNWELISDKPLDWWLPRLRRIKAAFPHKVLVASIMAGSEDEKEINHWRELVLGCQAQGVDAFELNLSCPHMDRVDMGSNIGKNCALIDTVVRAVKEVATRPVWVKLTPTTTNIAKEAEAAFNAGADSISSSNTFTSLPPIDPESLEFEVNVEGKVSYGGLGGPAILPLSLAKMAQMTTAFPGKSFSGIGGISDFSQALDFFLLGCGTAQVCTAAMLDHAIGPNVIKGLLSGMQAFLEKHADKGWRSLDDFRGLRRDRIVAHHEIKRPDDKEYHGGHEAREGYAAPVDPITKSA
jgi:dihydropyrimidine dehydrogenase (NAD+) subunit PreA